MLNVPFVLWKEESDRVVTRQKRVGDEEHRNTNRQKLPSLPSRLVSPIFATTTTPLSPPTVLTILSQLQMITTAPLPSTPNQLACRWSEFKVTVILALCTCRKTDRAQCLHYTKLRPRKTSWYVSPPSFSLVFFSL